MVSGIFYVTHILPRRVVNPFLFFPVKQRVENLLLPLLNILFANPCLLKEIPVDPCVKGAFPSAVFHVFFHVSKPFLSKFIFLYFSGSWWEYSLLLL